LRGAALKEWGHPRKDTVMDPRFPLTPEPAGAGDLPEVFDQLTGIDVVDGELIPRAAPMGE
jgi:hypothetical protein